SVAWAVCSIFSPSLVARLPVRSLDMEFLAWVMPQHLNPIELTGSLCLSQASSGIKAGYTLDGVPTHHTHKFTHYGQFRDSNQPRSMSVGGNRSTRRKPAKHGENTQTPHTQKLGV
ncbi:hypothetical protein QTP86_031274, partial [Hemibagrus guttatus]